MNRRLIGIILTCVGLGALLTVFQAWVLALCVRFAEIGTSIPLEDSKTILRRCEHPDWGSGMQRNFEAATHPEFSDSSLLIGQNVEAFGGTRRTVRLYDPEDHQRTFVMDEFAFGFPFRSMGYDLLRRGGYVRRAQSAFVFTSTMSDCRELPRHIVWPGFILNTLLLSVVAWAGLRLIMVLARLVFRRHAVRVQLVMLFTTFGLLSTTVLSLLLTTWLSGWNSLMLDRDVSYFIEPPPSMLRQLKRKQWVTPTGAELRAIRHTEFGSDAVEVYLYVPPESMPLAWGELRPEQNAQSIVERLRSGWPLRAFVGYQWHVLPPTYKRLPHVEEALWVEVVMHEAGYRDVEVFRTIALQPLWTGLAVDTTLFSLLWWLATIGPWHIRQHCRRRRGLCQSCAYDLRGTDHEACPECGEEIRKANLA